MDQFSKRTFTWLQKTAITEETLKGKIAFEKETESLNIKIQHYHADNGIFKANGWVRDCYDKAQSITYSGVNAHHQNRLAEVKIRWLQDLVRTTLAHAAQ